MQRRDNGNAVRPRHGRKIEREIQQIVDVDDVRLHRPQHVSDPVGDERRPVRLLEGGAYPVIDDLDDGQSLVHTPVDLAMRT